LIQYLAIARGARQPWHAVHGVPCSYLSCALAQHQPSTAAGHAYMPSIALTSQASGAPPSWGDPSVAINFISGSVCRPYIVSVRCCARPTDLPSAIAFAELKHASRHACLESHVRYMHQQHISILHVLPIVHGIYYMILLFKWLAIGVRVRWPSPTVHRNPSLTAAIIVSSAPEFVLMWSPESGRRPSRCGSVSSSQLHPMGTHLAVPALFHGPAPLVFQIGRRPRAVLSVAATAVDNFLRTRPLVLSYSRQHGSADGQHVIRMKPMPQQIFL
jgi:hypothetical protein